MSSASRKILRIPGKSCAILVIALSLLYTSALWGSAGVMLERLRSDYAAMVSAESDYHQRRERGTLKGNEAADYAGYVAGLHRRVAEDCVALEDQGTAIPEGIPCPEFTPQYILPVNIDQTAEQTSEEATSSLDAEFSSTLGEFDEVLLREQERVSAAASYGRAGTAGGRGSDGSEAGEDGGLGQEGVDTVATAATDSNGRPTSGQGAGPGSQQQRRRGNVTTRTPVDNGDDVVARQLREAAEKESDPELKKKLWEEYRKYKEGIS